MKSLRTESLQINKRGLSHIRSHIRVDYGLGITMGPIDKGTCLGRYWLRSTGENRFSGNYCSEESAVTFNVTSRTTSYCTTYIQDATQN